jgi:hypothetical protein
MYIQEFENIFSEDECRELIRIRNIHCCDYSDLVYWNNKENEIDLSKELNSCENRVSKCVKSYFDSFEGLLNLEDINLNGIGIIKQPQNAFDSLHFDTQVIFDNKQVKQRPFVCLLYLNDKGFDGGQLCFPVQKKIIEAKRGKVVIFPASYQFPHQVMGISGGDRYFVRFNYMFNESLFDKDVDKWNIETDGVMKFD